MVINNGPDSVGGGGSSRRAPWPPPIAPTHSPHDGDTMLGMFDTNKNLGGVWARLDGRVFSGVRHCLAHKRVPPCGQAVGTGADADLTIIQVDNNYDPI